MKLSSTVELRENLANLRDAQNIVGKSTGPTWSKLVNGVFSKKAKHSKRRPTWPSWSNLATLGPTWSKMDPYTLSHRNMRELKTPRSAIWSTKPLIEGDGMSGLEQANVLLQIALADPPRAKLPWDLQMHQTQVTQLLSSILRSVEMQHELALFKAQLGEPFLGILIFSFQFFALFHYFQFFSSIFSSFFSGT